MVTFLFCAPACEAVASASEAAEFVKVTEMNAILGCDLLATPRLVTDEKLACSLALRRRPGSGNG